MSEFVVNLDKMLTDEKQRNARIVGTAVLMLQEAVVKGTHGLSGTPYDTHQAQSNWFVEMDGCSGKTSDDTTLANLPLAQATVATALAKGKTLPNYFILYNNLPYIRHLEYGLYPNPPKNPTGKTLNGFSVQAPRGMLGLAVQKFNDCVEQAKGQP